MTIEQLRKGLELQNQIRNRTDELKTIKEYFSTNTKINISIASISVEVPKSLIAQKVQTRIQELQDELDILQAEFDAL